MLILQKASAQHGCAHIPTASILDAYNALLQAGITTLYSHKHLLSFLHKNTATASFKKTSNSEKTTFQFEKENPANNLANK